MNRIGIVVTACEDDGHTSGTRRTGDSDKKRSVFTSFVAVYLSLALSHQSFAQSFSIEKGENERNASNLHPLSEREFMDHQCYEHSTIRWFHHMPPPSIFKLSCNYSYKPNSTNTSTKNPKTNCRRKMFPSAKSKRCLPEAGTPFRNRYDHYFKCFRLHPVFGFNVSCLLGKSKLGGCSNLSTELPIINANLKAYNCVNVVRSTPSYGDSNVDGSFNDSSLDNNSIRHGVLTGNSFLACNKTSIDNMTYDGFVDQVNESNTVTEYYSVMTTMLMHNYGIINKLLFGYKEPSKDEAHDLSLNFYKKAAMSDNATQHPTTDVVLVTAKVEKERKSLLKFRSSQHCPTEDVYLPEYEKMFVPDERTAKVGINDTQSTTDDVPLSDDTTPQTK